MMRVYPVVPTGTRHYGTPSLPRVSPPPIIVTTPLAAVPVASAAVISSSFLPSSCTTASAAPSQADESSEPGESSLDVPEPIAAVAPVPVASSNESRILPRQAAVASSPAAAAAAMGGQGRALLVGLALVLVWGANYSVQKLIFPVVGPDGFLFVRYLMMPLLAIALMIHRFGVDWPPVERRDRWLLLKLAMAGHVLHVGLATWGVHLSTAFSSSVMSAVGPLFTLLLLRLTGSNERLSAAKVAGIVVAMAGILVFLSDKLLSEGWQAGWGDLVLLVATIFFSYYTVSAKDVINRIGGMTVMCYTTLLASPLMVIVNWQAGMGFDWSSLDWPVWLGIGWAVVVSAFLGWLLWGWVNAVRGVARTAPLMYLTPVIAGVVAWIVLGEQFSTIKFIGAALTLAGVVLAQARLGSRERVPQSAAAMPAPLVPARIAPPPEEGRG